MSGADTEAPIADTEARPADDSSADGGAKASELTVRLEVFEGPLDLLLYLIRKDELDVYDIPIVDITRQYVEYIDLMRMLDLDIAGEFIVMASSLMMIKSRMLLPAEARPELEEEDDIDPRLDLVRQLVEYRKFKDVADHLERLEEEQLNVFPRGAVHVDVEKEVGVSLRDVSIFDLINAFNEALKKVEREALHNIFTERYTIAEKIDDLMIRIRAQRQVSVSALFTGMRSRQEIICTFLAVLELIRLKQIEARPQKGHFGEIVIAMVGEEDE